MFPILCGPLIIQAVIVYSKARSMCCAHSYHSLHSRLMTHRITVKLQQVVSFNFQFLLAIVMYLCHALFCSKSCSRYPLKIAASAVDDTLLWKIEHQWIRAYEVKALASANRADLASLHTIKQQAHLKKRIFLHCFRGLGFWFSRHRPSELPWQHVPHCC